MRENIHISPYDNNNYKICKSFIFKKYLGLRRATELHGLFNK